MRTLKEAPGKMLAGSIGFTVLAAGLYLLPTELDLDRASAATEWRELEMPEGGVDTYRFRDTEFRTDTIYIPLPGNDGDLEYKLQMSEGDSIVYSWRVLNIENPDWFYSEFHGHTEPEDGVGDLMYYRRETGAAENGSFTAPFEGIHGWYLQNQTAEPVVVRLEIAGYYEIIPDQVPGGETASAE